MSTPEDFSHTCTSQRRVAAAMTSDAQRSRKVAALMAARAGQMMNKAIAAREQAAIDRAA